MTADYTALATTWATLPTGITMAKLATLNAMSVPGSSAIDVSVQTVNGYLVNQGKMQALMDYVISPPGDADANGLRTTNYLLTLLSGSDGTAILTSQPEIATMVQGLLTTMVADHYTGITQADADALLAMIVPQIMWWQANGFNNPVTVLDLITAGNLS